MLKKFILYNKFKPSIHFISLSNFLPQAAREKKNTESCAKSSGVLCARYQILVATPPGAGRVEG